MNMSYIVLWIIFTRKKFIYRVKLPTSIHWVEGWVGPGADLGVSKNKIFPSKLNLLQQSVSQHVKCVVCWLAAFEVGDLLYLVRSQKFPQTFSGICKTSVDDFEAVSKQNETPSTFFAIL